jgi:hypothetical protein
MKKLPTNTDMVVNTVIDTVTSRDPAPRYLIGPGAKHAAVLAQLPTSLQDYMCAKANKEWLPTHAQ